MANSLNLMM